MISYDNILFPNGKPKPKMRGLGDAVALIAQPIAKGIDAALGTDLQNCGGCKKRQEALNKAMPLN